MKRIFKIFISSVAVLLLTVQMSLFTSCNDDLAAESYYTFTGEMMSDYLKNREDFSLFRRIVERANRMDFMASRGSRTFFPAVNSGVEAFLQERGYSSVDDIPVEYCDTLVQTCLVENVVYTQNMSSTYQMPNELNMPLIVVTADSVVDENGMIVSVVNSYAHIINSLKNDSMDNGVVHPVDQLLVPNTGVGASILDESHEDFSIFYEALRRTGLLAEMDSVEYQSAAYEAVKENYPEFRTGIWSGGKFSEEDLYKDDVGNEFYARRPDHLYTGFTVLVVPDNVLYEKYPSYITSGMTMDEKIRGLYDLAVSKYDDANSAAIFGLNATDPESGQSYKERYWNFDEESLTSQYNPLNMFLRYHIIDRMFESTAKLINGWGVNLNVANPTEWVTTWLEFSMMKLERVFSYSEPEVEVSGGYYINHAAASVYNSGRVRGAILTQPSNNFSLNCAYYYLDDIVTYDASMRTNVMNTRIRMDMSTIWPELTTNGIRLAGYPNQAYSRDLDNSEQSLNYYIPSGYLANTEVSENTIFFVQRPKIEWWNWGGDEFNFLGTSYSIEFRLPPVPPGNYEVRMGYAGMIDRGIAQVYLNGNPVGIPIDLRYQANDSRVGGNYEAGWTMADAIRNMDEAMQENIRTMKNNGYYRGGASQYTVNGGASSNLDSYEDINEIMEVSQAMFTNTYTYRRKLCDVTVNAHEHNTIGIRSVWVQGNIGCFMIDYLELVPMSICGAGGLGEDNL